MFIRRREEFGYLLIYNSFSCINNSRGIVVMTKPHTYTECGSEVSSMIIGHITMEYMYTT